MQYTRIHIINYDIEFYGGLRPLTIATKNNSIFSKYFFIENEFRIKKYR